MGIYYKKFQPTEYVMKVTGGKVAAAGQGMSLWYDNRRTTLMVVPTTAMGTGFTFDDIVTSDYQRVNVQGDISYVIENYDKAAKMINFAYVDNDIKYQQVLSAAKTLIAGKIINRAKVFIAKYAANKDVRRVIRDGDELAMGLLEALSEDTTVSGFGLKILEVSVLGILPQADTRKALEAATREEILKQQDDALYMRRNAAINQERAIKENELNTEITLAKKDKEKQEKELEGKRAIKEKELEMKLMVQEEEAKLAAKKMADDIAMEEKNKTLVELKVESDKKEADVRIYEQEAMYKAFAKLGPEIVNALAMSGMDTGTLFAKALMNMGDKIGDIGVVNITPDMFQPLLNKLNRND